MPLAATLLTLLVIALHVAFAVAEMLFWQHPVVMQRFGTTADFARASSVLAANQGIYNALLAACLGWALWTANRGMQQALLWFVVAAGLYGAWSVKPTIFLVQSLPALLALGALWLAGNTAESRR